jgi:hypothetical protein
MVGMTSWPLGHLDCEGFLGRGLWRQ